MGLPGGSVVKNLPANSGEAGDLGSIPGWGRSLGGANGNPLRDSCLEKPMDRGAWRATVHGVTQELVRTQRLDAHTWQCFHLLAESSRPLGHLPV